VSFRWSPDAFHPKQFIFDANSSTWRLSAMRRLRGL
jgi:hypothetical protein